MDLCYCKKEVIALKDTAHLLRELQNCDSFRSFYQENAALLPGRSLAECLDELVKKHSIKKSAAIRRAELNEIYGYQIFSGVRVPERKKLLSLLVGMELELDEVQKLLKCTGYAPLYAKNGFDCVILFGIYKKMTVAQINELLYEHEMELLG